MHLNTQNVREIIKNYLFYYMKMNPRVFASNAFLIDVWTNFDSQIDDFFVPETPFSYLNRTLGLNLVPWALF